MEINIRRTATYLEMTIAHGGTALYGTFLDEAQSVEMATALIRVAEQLLPAGYGGEEFKLSEIREKLGKCE